MNCRDLDRYLDAYGPRHICEAILDDGSIVEYDEAIGEDYYNKHKKALDAGIFSDPKKEFLGWGEIYSVDGAKQVLIGKYRSAFFRYK